MGAAWAAAARELPAQCRIVFTSPPGPGTLAVNVTRAAHAAYAIAAAQGHGAKSFLATLLAIEGAAGAHVERVAKS